MLTEQEEGKVRDIIGAFDNGKSVTELNAATTLGGNDVMEVLQGGENKKVPVSVVKQSVNSDVLTDLNKRGVFNVTVSVPLSAGTYYTLSTAIAAVPTASKSLGLDLKFSTAANTWVVYRYKGSDLSGWSTTTNWEQVPDAAKLSSLETDLNVNLDTRITSPTFILGTLDSNGLLINSTTRLVSDYWSMNDYDIHVNIGNGYKVAARVYNYDNSHIGVVLNFTQNSITINKSQLADKKIRFLIAKKDDSAITVNDFENSKFRITRIYNPILNRNKQDILTYPCSKFELSFTNNSVFYSPQLTIDTAYPSVITSTDVINVKDTAIKSIKYTGRAGTSCVVGFDANKQNPITLLTGGDYNNREVEIPNNIHYIACSSRTMLHSSPPSFNPKVEVVTYNIQTITNNVFDLYSKTTEIDFSINKYNSSTVSENTRINPSSGAESYRQGWVVTDYISFEKLKEVRLKSSSGELIRDFVFLYDSNKNYVKSIGNAIVQNSLGQEHSFVVDFDGYFRTYVDQSIDGGYPSYVNSLIVSDARKSIVKELSDSVSNLIANADYIPTRDNIIIGKQLSVNPNERHIIDRTNDYYTFLANAYDSIKELKKINIGKTVAFQDKPTYDMFAYEYVPAGGHKKTAFINANTHGGERESAYALARVVNIIINESWRDDRIKWMKDNVRLLIIPSANPYGFNQDVMHYNDAGWSWRSYQGNARGVNNNRNWDFGWDNSVINNSGSDYVGTNRLGEETNNYFENIIKPNINDIDFWFDCHQADYYGYRYWIETCTESQLNPIGMVSVNFIKDLANTKKTLKTVINTSGAEAKHFAFSTNVACIPGYTLENNSLPGTGVNLLNYTSESVTNYAEYILNMIYINALSDYKPRKSRSFGTVFRSRLLPAPVSKMYGDMFNDTSNKIYERFDEAYNKMASITKTQIGTSGLKPVYSYVVDKTSNYSGDVIVVGGMLFDVQTKIMYTVASERSERTSNETTSRTMALGTKHIYAMLHLMEDIADGINADDVLISDYLSKYKIHFIPLLNIEGFDTLSSISGFDNSALIAIISNYISTLIVKRVILFDETKAADKSVIADTNSLDSLSDARSCCLKERITTYTVGNSIPTLLSDISEICIVRYKSSLYYGADYTTDQLTLYASLIVNLSK